MDLQVLQQEREKIIRSLTLDANDTLDLNSFDAIPKNSQLYLAQNVHNTVKKLIDKQGKTILFSKNFTQLTNLISGIVKSTYDKQTQTIISGLSEKIPQVLRLNNYIIYYSALNNQSQLPQNPKVGSAYSISGNLYIYSPELHYIKLLSKQNIPLELLNNYCKKQDLEQKDQQINQYLNNYQMSISGNIENLTQSLSSIFLNIEQAQQQKSYLSSQILSSKQQYESSIQQWRSKYQILSSQYINYQNRLEFLQNQINILSGIINRIIQ